MNFTKVKEPMLECVTHMASDSKGIAIFIEH